MPKKVRIYGDQRPELDAELMAQILILLVRELHQRQQEQLHSRAHKQPARPALTDVAPAAIKEA